MLSFRTALFWHFLLVKQTNIVSHENGNKTEGVVERQLQLYCIPNDTEVPVIESTTQKLLK